MPLYAYDGLLLAAFYGFDGAVGCRGCGAHVFAGIVYSLMVERVDVDGVLAVEYVAQQCAWSDVHAVRLGGLMRRLRVLD